MAGRKPPSAKGSPAPLRHSHRERSISLAHQVLNRIGAAGDQWIVIHSNGIHTYPLEWTAGWIGLGAVRPCGMTVEMSKNRGAGDSRALVSGGIGFGILGVAFLRFSGRRLRRRRRRRWFRRTLNQNIIALHIARQFDGSIGGCSRRPSSRVSWWPDPTYGSL